MTNRFSEGALQKLRKFWRLTVLPIKWGKIAGVAAQIAGLVVVGMLAIFPIESDDLFINIKTGEIIWQSKSLPTHDVFSYTVNDLEWINHEWITTILIYLLYHLGGFNLLIQVKAAVILFSFGILMWEARRLSCHSWVLAPLLIFLAYTTSDRFIERAHIANMVLLAIYLVVLFRWRNGSNRTAYWLPIITLAWINFHSGAIIGPMLMAIVMLCDFLQLTLGSVVPFLHQKATVSSRHLKQALLPLFLHLPALVVTPYFYRSVLYPLQQANWDIYRHHVYEWMPVYAPLYRRTPVFTVFIISSLLLIIALLLNYRKFQLVDLGLAIFALTIGQSAIRFTDVFCILAFWVIARQLKDFEWAKDRYYTKVRFQLAALLVAILCGTIILKHGYVITIGLRTFRLGVSAFNYPTIPLDYIERLGIKGNMFNQYDIGSFIIWKWYPQRKVFIDGRNQVYPVAFYQEYLSVNTSSERLEQVMDKYEINFIILLNQAQPPPHPKGVYDFLSESDRWRLIYWDDMFLVYLKNTPENRAVIEQYEFRYYDPVLPPELTLVPNLQREPKASLAELERVLSLNPNCFRAQVLLTNSRKFLEQSGIRVE